MGYFGRFNLGYGILPTPLTKPQYLVYIPVNNVLVTFSSFFRISPPCICLWSPARSWKHGRNLCPRPWGARPVSSERRRRVRTTAHAQVCSFFYERFKSILAQTDQCRFIENILSDTYLKHSDQQMSELKRHGQVKQYRSVHVRHVELMFVFLPHTCQKLQNPIQR